MKNKSTKKYLTSDKRNKRNHKFNVGGSVIGTAVGLAKEGIQEATNSIFADTARDIATSSKYSKLDPSIVEENVSEIENTAGHSAANPFNVNSVLDAAGSLSLSTPMTWRDIYSTAKESQGGSAGVAGDLFGAGAGQKNPISAGISMLRTGIAIGAGRGKLKRQAKDLAKDLKKDSAIANRLAIGRMLSQAGSADAAQDFAIEQGYIGANGGTLRGINDESFDNSIYTVFNNGGTHAENPFGGIPQGVAPDGLPNLVEEGEVKIKKGLSELLDNYIFSDRLSPNKELIEKYPRYKNKSNADIAKLILKEYDETPNDPISKNTTRSLLEELYMDQENTRQKRYLKGENRLFPEGGNLDETDDPELFDPDDEFREELEDETLNLNNYSQPNDLTKLAEEALRRQKARKIGNILSDALGAAGVIGTALQSPTKIKGADISSQSPIITGVPSHPIYTPLIKPDYQRQITRAQNQINAERAKTVGVSVNPYVNSLLSQNITSKGISSIGDLYQNIKSKEAEEQLKRDTYHNTLIGDRGKTNATLALQKASLDQKRLDSIFEQKRFDRTLQFKEDALKSEALSKGLSSLAQRNDDREFERKHAISAMAKLASEGKLTDDLRNIYANEFGIYSPELLDEMDRIKNSKKTKRRNSLLTR